MGATLSVFRVDMREMLSCVGCADRAGLEAVFESNAQILEEDEDPEYRDSDVPTIREALTGFIMDGVITEDAQEKYPMVLDALCTHLGEQLYCDKLGINGTKQVDKILQKRGVSPNVRMTERIPCTLPAGFPPPAEDAPMLVIDAAEIEPAVQRLQPLDVMGFDADTAFCMINFFKWLQAAQGQSLVLIWTY